MRTEEEFISEVDCEFPYEQHDRAVALIHEAVTISPNAAFMVVHELVRRPRGSNVTAEACLNLLNVIDARFEHPLKRLVFDLANRMILGSRIDASESLSAMRQIGEHRSMFNALNIAYFSGNSEMSEADKKAYEEVYDRVIVSWMD